MGTSLVMASLVSSWPRYYLHWLQEAVSASSAGSKGTDPFFRALSPDQGVFGCPVDTNPGAEP